MSELSEVMSEEEHAIRRIKTGSVLTRFYRLKPGQVFMMDDSLFFWGYEKVGRFTYRTADVPNGIITFILPWRKVRKLSRPVGVEFPVVEDTQ